MNVKIQTVRFEADLKLVEYVKRKLEKLSTFHDRIVKVDVFLKLGGSRQLRCRRPWFTELVEFTEFRGRGSEVLIESTVKDARC